MAPGRGPPMSDGRYVLGVDLGTGGPKVALMGVGGHLVGHEKEKVPLILQPGGGAEQDPQAWWDAIVACTRRLLDWQSHPNCSRHRL